MTVELCARLLAARKFQPQRYFAFEIGGRRIGWIRRSEAERLRAWPDIFAFSPERISIGNSLEKELTENFAEVAQSLAREGAIRGWRGETYAVRAKAGGEALFHIERAAMRFFGLTSSAAHLNGFVFQNEDSTIWIARRSATKSIDPGMLDNLVAGGVRSGQDAWQTLLRECGEEAGIPVALAQRARPAGVLRVCHDVPEGLDSEILHVYDLALPAGFTPCNTDGEVSEFLSLDAGALLERIARGELTVEAGLVAADFALRHGILQDQDKKIASLIGACRGPTLT